MKALAYPYITLSILMAALSALLYYGTDPSMTFTAQINSLLHGGSRISPFWFLRILLVVELVYWFVAQLPSRYSLPVLGCMLCVAIYLIPDMGPDLFPVRKIINALLFYLLGYASKKILSMNLSVWALMVVALAFILGHIGLLALDYSNVTFFASRGTGDQLLRVAVSLLGILGVVYISKLLDKTTHWMSNGLSWLGVNSIILLAIHGHCGLFRKTWTCFAGWQSSLLSIALMCLLMWLLSCPCKFVVKMPKLTFKRGTKAQ